MAALDTLVVATALSTIRLDLGASVEQLEWTVNAYNLSFAVLLMTGAALGDRFGRRRMYAVGLGLFAVASAACALAPNVGWLIAARAVQGAGAALVMPLGLALLSAAFPPERRGAAIGIFSAITGLAVASGPLVGGAVVEGIAWQWIFWINVPIGLARDPARAPRIARELRAATPASTSAAWRWSPAARSGSSGAWCAATRPAGAAPRCSAPLVGGRRCWSRRSSPGSGAPASRCCRCASSASRAFSAGNAAIFFTFASLFAAVFFYAQLLQTGARLRPARRRPAAAAVDGDLHDRRPDRRRAGRPDRRAAADGRRARRCRRSGWPGSR